jgi:hypothetical protein
MNKCSGKVLDSEYVLIAWGATGCVVCKLVEGLLAVFSFAVDILDLVVGFDSLKSFSDIS